MDLPKDIATTEALLARVPKHPSQMSLSQLIKWVQENDPRYAGLSDEELFVKGCGDAEQAKMLHREARASGTCSLMRQFCIACIERCTREMLSKPTQQKSIPAT